MEEHIKTAVVIFSLPIFLGILIVGIGNIAVSIDEHNYPTQKYNFTEHENISEQTYCIFNKTSINNTINTTC